MSTIAYATPTAAGRYGAAFLPGAQAARAQDTPLVAVAGPSAEDKTSPLSPDHPVFWLGVILAGAVGLAYFSTTVRVGPATAGVSVGKK